MKTFLFCLFATSSLFCISAEVTPQESSYEAFTKAFLENVNIQDDGTLLLIFDSSEGLPSNLAKNLTNFVDLLNADIVSGKLAPFAKNAFAAGFPMFLCECERGCCQWGYCYKKFDNGLIVQFECY